MVLKWDLSHLTPAQVVDIGAHNGETAIAFDLLIPGVVVYSFEPNPACFQRATENTAGRKIRVFGIGLSDHSGVERFVTREWDALSTFDISPDTAGVDDGATFLPVRRGDEVIDLDRIDLLKIDVEGYEGHVLRGLDRVLDKVSYMVIEWSLARPKDHAFKDMADVLSPHGFDLVGTGAPSYHNDGSTQITVDMFFRRQPPYVGGAIRGSRERP